MNRKLLMLATAGGFALTAAAAHAQPGPGAEPWSGVYVGANGGWNWGTTDGSTSTTVNQLSGLNDGSGVSTAPAYTFNSDRTRRLSNGFQGGGQLGFNVQRGPIVFGLEGDFDGLWGRGRQSDNYALPATAGLTTGSTVAAYHQSDPQWEATARGRLGFATGRALFYGTGGAAWVNMRERAAYTYTPTTVGGISGTYGPYSDGSSDSTTRLGWTAGAGVEFMLNPAVTIGAEYRHTDVGLSNVAYGTNTTNGVYETGRVGFRDDAVLGRINFKFGGWPHWF